MMKAIKPKDKNRVPVQAVPNYGLAFQLDKGLQKQLEDLNAMKGLNHDISKRIRKLA